MIVYIFYLVCPIPCSPCVQKQSVVEADQLFCAQAVVSDALQIHQTSLKYCTLYQSNVFSVLRRACSIVLH